MQVRWLTTLYDYSRWANGRILDTAAALTPEQFLAPVPVGGSLRGILAHTLGAQWLWLARCQGRSPRALWDVTAIPDLPTLRREWRAVEEATATFVGELTDERLGADLTYASTGGSQRTQPLWQLLLHQATHAIQHRSEAASLLTQAGHSPGDLDLLRYLLRHAR